MKVGRKWIHVSSVYLMDKDEWRIIGGAIKKKYPNVKTVHFVQQLAGRGYVDAEFTDGRREPIGLWKIVTRGKRKGAWIMLEPDIVKTIRQMLKEGDPSGH